MNAVHEPTTTWVLNEQNGEIGHCFQSRGWEFRKERDSDCNDFRALAGPRSEAKTDWDCWLASASGAAVSAQCVQSNVRVPCAGWYL